MPRAAFGTRRPISQPATSTLSVNPAGRRPTCWDKRAAAPFWPVALRLRHALSPSGRDDAGLLAWAVAGLDLAPCAESLFPVNLQIEGASPEDFRHFTGVDGSAYVIGGVGMTLLTGGDVIMAPIEPGWGLRVGANIGYVRFTRAPSWNPF